MRQAEQRAGISGALGRSWARLRSWAGGDEERSPVERHAENLAIRWFTPRGRELLQELLDDLRFHEGAHLGAILSEIRRDGVAEHRLDLRGVDLSGEDLGGAKLAQADLRGAKLAGCRLAQADLEGAWLERADLQRCSLRGARLRGARLRGVDLRGADLTEADLRGAEVPEARLEGADLKRAQVQGVNFARASVEGVDLSRTLEEPPTTPRRASRRFRAVGAPPMSEPRTLSERRRDTQRIAAVRTGASETLERPKTRRMPPPLPKRPGEAAPSPCYDAALAELLALREQAEQVVVVVGGERRVLFERAA